MSRREIEPGCRVRVLPVDSTVDGQEGVAIRSAKPGVMDVAASVAMYGVAPDVIWEVAGVHGSTTIRDMAEVGWMPEQFLERIDGDLSEPERVETAQPVEVT